MIAMGSNSYWTTLARSAARWYWLLANLIA